MYDCYNKWILGDTKLSWYPEDYSQLVECDGAKGQGSPMGWTTNDASKPGFNALNQWGDDYWMLDTYMDCSRLASEDGWFEFKGLTNTGIRQLCSLSVHLFNYLRI